MAVPVSIESALGDKLLDVITRWCQTDVGEDDESRANHVVLGKPTTELRSKVVVTIHLDHPLGPSFDKDKDAREASNSVWPAETVGGMRSRVIIGAIQINIREGLPFSTAKAINGAVAARVEAAINQDAALRPFTDDFGNFMSKIETFQASGYQSGGGNVSINIRWIDWRAFVHSIECRA